MLMLKVPPKLCVWILTAYTTPAPTLYMLSISTVSCRLVELSSSMLIWIIRHRTTLCSECLPCFGRSLWTIIALYTWFVHSVIGYVQLSRTNYRHHEVLSKVCNWKLLTQTYDLHASTSKMWVSNQVSKLVLDSSQIIPGFTTTSLNSSAKPN